MAGKKGAGKRASKGGENSKSPKKRAAPAAASNGAGQASILTFFGKHDGKQPSVGGGGGSGDVCLIDGDSSHGAGVWVARPAESFVYLLDDDDDDVSSKPTGAATGGAGANLEDVIDLDSDEAGEDGEGSSHHVSKLEEKPAREQAAAEKLETKRSVPAGASSQMQLQKESVSKSEAGSDPTRILADDYHPEVDACWKRGEGAPFLHLARTFSVIDNEKGRYKLRTAVSNMFRSVLRLSPEDTLACVYLTTGKIAPASEGTDLNIGGSAVCAAIAEVTGVSTGSTCQKKVYRDQSRYLQKTFQSTHICCTSDYIHMFTQKIA